MISNKEYKFKAINPYRPKFIFPAMFHCVTFILWISFFLMCNIYSESTSIFSRIVYFYVYLVSKFDILGFLVYALTIFAPIIIGNIIFRRYLLKYYLSDVKVKLCEDYISIDFISFKEKYCVSKKIFLNELKSYAISRSITITKYSRNSNLISNMGIRLVSENGKMVFRLIDNYRFIPLCDDLEDIKGMVLFSKALKKYIDNYNKNSNRVIKFSVPAKWKRVPRFIFTILTVLGVLFLVVLIILSIISRGEIYREFFNY